MYKFLQKLGKSLMLPVAALPMSLMAGIMVVTTPGASRDFIIRKLTRPARPTSGPAA